MTTCKSFIWYELMTTDPDAAARFYGKVVGWSVAPHSAPGSEIDYRMIVRSDGGNAGGVLGLSDAMCENGVRPAWMGYLHAPDVDAMVADFEAQGGAVLMPPNDLPVGRIAMVTDPQGAPIYLMNPTPPEGAPDAASDVFSTDQPQHVRWNELSSSDAPASIAFYTRHFGWVQDEAMSMGDMGDYSFIKDDGVTIGAIMPKMPQLPMSVWNYYIGVDSIDRARAAVEAEGGTIMMGPHEVPGGDWIIVGTDPQGAVFGLVGPKD